MLQQVCKNNSYELSGLVQLFGRDMIALYDDHDYMILYDDAYMI